MRKLNETNSLFLANLMGVSKRGCPEASLYVETSSLLISNQILLSQLLFLHHIANLPETSLAKEAYIVVKNRGYPGLYRVCERYLIEGKMTDIQNHSKSS